MIRNVLHGLIRWVFPTIALWEATAEALEDLDRRMGWLEARMRELDVLPDGHNQGTPQPPN